MQSKLTPEDQATLEKLIDPQQEVRFPYGEEFQRMVMGMLLCNRFFLVQCQGLVKWTFFSHEAHQMACRIVFAYFDKHRQLPSKIYVREMVDTKLREKYQDPETLEAMRLLYLGELNTVYSFYAQGGVGDMVPALDEPEAILDHIVSFARTQAIKAAFSRAIDLVRRNPESDDTWLQVDELYKEARLVNRKIDIGLDYFQEIEERYARMQMSLETQDLFTSGFPSIDRGLNGGGLKRGELGAWMALPGVGKSLCLVVASVKNLQAGKKVLYISTEMDQDLIGTRFDAMLTLIGQHELLPRKEEVWRMLRQEVSGYEDKQRLIVKQFPSGSADCNVVRAYHSQLVMLGFRPDLVIVDYPGDFRESANVSEWQEAFRILRNLRGFGVEEKHCTLIAIQPNRGSTELGIDEFMDASKQANSFKQNQVFDAFWTLNQTRHEKLAHVGRAFVDKHRNGKSKYHFYVGFDYRKQTLWVRELSHDKYKIAYNAVTEREAQNLSIDEITARVTEEQPHWQPSEGERVG